MQVYRGSFRLPVNPGLTEPIVNFLKHRGYEASIEKTGEFDFQLTVDKPLDGDAEEKIYNAPHATSFHKVE